MQLRNPPHRAVRRGLTLVELIVVLTILVAVATIIIPLLPNVLTKANQATDTTQITELAKAIQSYRAATTAYPDNLDLLTDGTTMPAYLPESIPSGGTTPVALGGYAVAGPLTAAELTALNNAGIQFVQPMATDTTGAGFQATVNPYTSDIASNQTTISPTATTLNFAVIDPNTNTNLPTNFLQVARNADPTARYVLLGVGSRCSMVSKTIQEAPMAVPTNRIVSPSNTYFRYGVIYKVSGTEIAGTTTSAGTGTARLVAIVSLESGIPQGSEQELVNFFGSFQQ